MKKFIAKMRDANEVFDYSVMAEDLFEADKKAMKIAQSRGWICIEVNPEVDSYEV